MQQILQSYKVLQKVLQDIKSIAISIAKFQNYCNNYCKFRKYCNKYCKISKILQYLLQNLKSIAILIAKLQSIAILCNTIETTPGSDKHEKITFLYYHNTQSHWKLRQNVDCAMYRLYIIWGRYTLKSEKNISFNQKLATYRGYNKN